MPAVLADVIGSSFIRPVQVEESQHCRVQQAPPGKEQITATYRTYEFFSLYGIFSGNFTCAHNIYFITKIWNTDTRSKISKSLHLHIFTIFKSPHQRSFHRLFFRFHRMGLDKPFSIVVDLYTLFLLKFIKYSIS